MIAILNFKIMKKIILFCLISNYTFAQITLSGSITYPGLNLTFSPVSGVPPTDCYISFNDAGTNVYKASVTIPASGNVPTYRIDYYISRRNNYWHIEAFNYLNPNPHNYYVYYVSQNTSSDINPPCSAIWKIYTGNCFPYGGGNISFTGNTTSNLVLIGTCASLPMLAGCITPQYLQLPQLTTTQINAIVSPKKGMLVFDVIANEVKSYNGASWQTQQRNGFITLLR